MPSFSHAEEKQKVRVGYLPSEKIILHYEENGQEFFKGYIGEFLEVMSVYGNFEYEFVEGTWDECKQWLREGKIDLLPGVMQEDAGEDVELSKLPLITVCDSIYIKKENSIRYGDYFRLNNSKIGYIQGEDRNQEFFDEHDIECEFKTYANYADLLQAFKKGEINATMSVENYEEQEDMTLLTKLSPKCLYMGYNTGNDELKKHLESTFEQIMVEMPDLIDKLQKKYDTNLSSKKVVLSQMEKSWIVENPQITVAYVVNKMPNEYKDEEGRAQGIHIAYIEEILKSVGLRADWVGVSNSEQAYSYLEKGLVDAIATSCINDERVEAGEILVTDSYRDCLFSVIGKKNTDLKNPNKAPVFAVPKGDQLSGNFIRANYPNSRIITKDSEEEVFKAIRSGEAKATVTLANMEEYYCLKYNTALEALEDDYQGIEVAIGVRKNGNGQILVSILNQGIHSLSSSTVNSIIVNNSGMKNEYPFWMQLKKYRWHLAAGILLLTLVGIIAFSFHRRRQREALWRASYVDKITGQDNFEKMMIDARPLFDGKNQGKYCIVSLDIVKFKNINDTFGYNVGNKVLEVMADIIVKECQEGEYSARSGADQFALILKGKVTNEHVQRVERLTERIEKGVNKLDYDIKAHCVAGLYLLQDDLDPYYAFDKANLARKAARDSHGRNVVVYDAHMHKRALKEREIESVMYQALADEEFQVYLQPRVKIATGEIVAAEALVRWRRKNGEMIYPDTFIPLFEANGFIHEMDFYIYEKVCEALQKRLEQKQVTVPVSVNVSRAHFESGDFIESFNDLLSRFEVPKEYIELELTESLLVEDPSRMIMTAERLKANNYILAIDDFGSGYSSLNILKQLHFDVLKIDKEFLRMDGIKEEDKIILESVVQMAKKLNMQVLVEGVETKEHQEILTEMGCDFAQGYYFSRPVPMRDFYAMLERQQEEKNAIEKQ